MKIIKFMFPLLILNLTALILVTFGLLNIIPIHMNLSGVVHEFVSKYHVPIFEIIPIFMIIIYIVYIYFSKPVPNKKIEDKIIIGIINLFMIISWIPVILTISLGSIDLSSSSSLVLFGSNFIYIYVTICFFIFMGYYMKKIKLNNYFGINKTPLTLKNEIV